MCNLCKIGYLCLFIEFDSFRDFMVIVFSEIFIFFIWIKVSGFIDYYRIIFILFFGIVLEVIVFKDMISYILIDLEFGVEYIILIIVERGR